MQDTSTTVRQSLINIRIYFQIFRMLPNIVRVTTGIPHRVSGLSSLATSFLSTEANDRKVNVFVKSNVIMVNNWYWLSYYMRTLFNGISK